MTSMNVFMFPPSVLSLFLCVCGGEGGMGRDCDVWQRSFTRLVDLNTYVEFFVVEKKIVVTVYNP